MDHICSFRRWICKVGTNWVDTHSWCSSHDDHFTHILPIHCSIYFLFAVDYFQKEDWPAYSSEVSLILASLSLSRIWEENAWQSYSQLYMPIKVGSGWGGIELQLARCWERSLELVVVERVPGILVVSWGLVDLGPEGLARVSAVQPKNYWSRKCLHWTSGPLLSFLTDSPAKSLPNLFYKHYIRMPISLPLCYHHVLLNFWIFPISGK